jgi:translation initiation factor IF-2
VLLIRIVRKETDNTKYLCSVVNLCNKTNGLISLQGLNASLFYDNPDIRSYVSLVPTSAITGEGIGNLLALIVDSCQNMLAKRLMYSEELQVLSGEYLCLKKTKFLDQLHRCLHLINKFLHLP